MSPGAEHSSAGSGRAPSTRRVLAKGIDRKSVPGDSDGQLETEELGS